MHISAVFIITQSCNVEKVVVFNVRDMNVSFLTFLFDSGKLLEFNSSYFLYEC